MPLVILSEDWSGWYMPCLTFVDSSVAGQYCCTAHFSLSCIFSSDGQMPDVLSILCFHA
jgi:hypothetical protein